MDFRTMSTEDLKKTHTVAMAEIAKGEAEGVSETVMKARYATLGAVSAVLATR